MALSDAAASAVANWAMEESSGDALDSVGSNDAVEKNGPIGSTTGQFGNARTLTSASSQYFDAGDTPDLSTSDADFCFVVWAYGTSLAGNPMIFSKWDDATSSLQEVQLFFSGGFGRFRWIVSDGAGNAAAVNSNSAPTANAWHLIVVYHDSVNNLIGISVDGDTYNTTAYSNGGNDSGQQFFIGARENSATPELYWDGRIDDLTMLKGRILTQAEVTELWNSGTGVAFADWSAATSIDPSGIVSEQTFGTTALTQSIASAGIASAEAFGSAAVVTSQQISPSGIASAEAVGSHQLSTGAGPVHVQFDLPARRSIAFAMNCRRSITL